MLFLFNAESLLKKGAQDGRLLMSIYFERFQRLVNTKSLINIPLVIEVNNWHCLFRHLSAPSAPMASYQNDLRTLLGDSVDLGSPNAFTQLQELTEFKFRTLIKHSSNRLIFYWNMLIGLFAAACEPQNLDQKHRDRRFAVNLGSHGEMNVRLVTLVILNCTNLFQNTSIF